MKIRKWSRFLPADFLSAGYCCITQIPIQYTYIRADNVRLFVYYHTKLPQFASQIDRKIYYDVVMQWVYEHIWEHTHVQCISILAFM